MLQDCNARPVDCLLNLFKIFVYFLRLRIQPKAVAVQKPTRSVADSGCLRGVKKKKKDGGGGGWSCHVAPCFRPSVHEETCVAFLTQQIVQQKCGMLFIHHVCLCRQIPRHNQRLIWTPGINWPATFQLFITSVGALFIFFKTLNVET